MSKCGICKVELTDAQVRAPTQDCGGDCLQCMAMCGDDPDCMAAMSELERFMAPGPWITRDLKLCVLASAYDAQAALLAEARALLDEALVYKMRCENLAEDLAVQKGALLLSARKCASTESQLQAMRTALEEIANFRCDKSDDCPACIATHALKRLALADVTPNPVPPKGPVYE